MNRWVISDTHFCHNNILKYCNRPFETIEEMNDTIIKNWNNTIARDDIVYVLGDFLLGSKDALREITPMLNGRKILVMGNHDRGSKKSYLEAGFEQVYGVPIIVDADFILSHQPQQGDLGKYFNIHGHRHKLPHEAQFSPKHFDIGVDDHNFFPHNLDTVEKLLYKSTRKTARNKVLSVSELDSSIVSTSKMGRDGDIKIIPPKSPVRKMRNGNLLSNIWNRLHKR